MLTIYTNFAGWTGPTWGETQRVVTTPPAGFTPDAQAEIVRRVAKHFERFNVTVTDQRPADLSYGKCLHCIIGGDIAGEGG